MEARRLALAVLTLARASMGFQFQSLASVAPLLIEDLALGYAEVGFLIGLYMLPGVVLALPGGVLGQRFGDTRVVVVGLALMTAGGALAGAGSGAPRTRHTPTRSPAAGGARSTRESTAGRPPCPGRA
jgi:MFS family permease